MISRYTRKEAGEIWSEEYKFQLWLEIEILALEAMVKAGRVPQEALDNVRKKAHFDVARIAEIENDVKHDVIAFLTNVAEYVGESARFLHLGMTSSDLLDTCFSLQLTRALDLILSGLDALLEAVKRRALQHKFTVCVGRSHGVHAEPTTFGLKLACWYSELCRHKRRLGFAREDIAVGAISGPVGTYAHLGPDIEKHVCEVFGLKPVAVSTQIIQRDRHAHLFSSMAGLGNTLEKICVEVRHLQRTEVREAEENFTKGQKGSSAMPHKRNPILSENVTGLARLVRSLSQAAMENVALWHERDISHSSAERVIAPDICIALDFMVNRVRSIIDGLVVYVENMQKNLESTEGLVFSGSLLVALASKGLSREDAYALVQNHAMAVWDELSKPGRGENFSSFPERIRADAKIGAILTKEELDEVFSLAPHLQHVDYIFSRVFEV
ncbi:MAG: adenylosuccinate lyase [Deltaproteobacteria bacterium]|nr:adenylosuccinate lyase [Deltaproteobacteria bacterium]